MELAVVQKNAKFYVFFDGVLACEISETSTYDGGV
jgi:hypothetical protein